jgi:hypothetical protein
MIVLLEIDIRIFMRLSSRSERQFRQRQKQRIAERAPLRVHICYSCRRLVNVRQLRNVLILVLLNQYADDFHKRCERM